MQKTKYLPFFSSFLKKLLHYRAFGPIVAYVVLFISFSFLTNFRFSSALSVSSILTTAPEFGILAIGVAFLMIVQEFDLSVGSVFTFCTFEYATLLLNFNVQPILALVIVLVSGTLMGLLNGAITFAFRIPAIIVTLGTMYFWRGLTLVFSGGLPVSFVGANRDIIPFKSILVGDFFGIPTQFLWFLALAIVFEVILYRHKLGNRMTAVGGNDAAAAEMGIKIRTIKLICFTLTGLLVAFCAILQTSRIYEGSARLGVGYEFYAIASVVIGGTSIKGGSGTVIGTIAGALILQSIGIGLSVMGISGYYINVFVGAIIILVMALNALVGRRRR